MGETLRRNIMNVKRLYSAEKVVNSIKDGAIAYPPDNEKASGSGMAFDLRYETFFSLRYKVLTYVSDVTFSYPGSKTETPALSSISLSIRPGQLVIVVGANGSGKSTLIRLLSRLYDPTSGEILIDGSPSKSYRLHDLHQATAILSQDNQIYPLSLRENIALGFPEAADDTEAITQAAKNGGAWNLIEKLKDGLDTHLDATDFAESWNLDDDTDHPLYQDLEKREKKADLSGGEKQRIVAYVLVGRRRIWPC